MKKRVLPMLAVAGSLCFATACNNQPESDKAETGEAVEIMDAPAEAATLQIDTTQSSVTWVGSKVTGSHPGSLDIQDGSIKMQGDSIVGGSFTIDMQSLRATDENMDQENNEKLTGHLKSGDFFEVEKYPTATFEIQSVQPIAGNEQVSQNTKEVEEGMRGDYSQYRINNPTHKVTGNLTMKGETKSITFPARIDKTGNGVQAVANFNIDRRDWNLTYGADQSLGDKMLYSDVNIGFNIKATK